MLLMALGDKAVVTYSILFRCVFSAMRPVQVSFIGPGERRKRCISRGAVWVLLRQVMSIIVGRLVQRYLLVNFSVTVRCPDD